MLQSLPSAYNVVKDLIPDYGWCTIINRSGDLVHILSGITLSTDIDGYYLYCSKLPGTDQSLPMFIDGDFAKATTDPCLAVQAFVAEVLTTIMQERFNNK